MSASTEILKANLNEQTNFNPEDAINNMNASHGQGFFDFSGPLKVVSGRPVVFVGGAPTALEEYERTIEALGGRENVDVVVMGSAYRYFDVEGQSKNNKPFIKDAPDFIVFNGVDGSDSSIKEYYDAAAQVMARFPDLQIILSSTSGPDAYNAFEATHGKESIGRVPVLVKGIDHPENISAMGMGSTAVTGATIMFATDEMYITGSGAGAV